MKKFLLAAIAAIVPAFAGATGAFIFPVYYESSMAIRGLCYDTNGRAGVTGTGLSSDHTRVYTLPPDPSFLVETDYLGLVGGIASNFV